MAKCTHGYRHKYKGKNKLVWLINMCYENGNLHLIYVLYME
jgi:hypothetical protein